MTTRILFVDDEPHFLQGLRHLLHSMRTEWELDFAQNGPEALVLLAQQPFDVVVSDMRMPGMDGAQLLNEIRQRYPQVVRLILSGHSDHEMILRSVSSTHQFLAKPCDADELKSTLTRVLALQELVANSSLQRVVAGIQTLPSNPSLYGEVRAVLQTSHQALEEVGKIIEQDIGMSAKVLQLVNSAFFGRPRHVLSTVQAVKILGEDTLQTLMLSSQMANQGVPTLVQSQSLHALWDHSLAIAACAKRLAQMEQCSPPMVETAFMAGVLHDVGKLVLLAYLPAAYEQVLTLAQAEDMACWEAEQAVLGVSHAEVGAYLAGLWGLAQPLVEALAYHHHPSDSPDHCFSPLTAVHVADVCVHACDIAPGSQRVRLDDAYLARLHVSERLEDWRECCRTVLQEDVLHDAAV